MQNYLTGFKDLDLNFTISAGNMIVIASQTGVGKTTFALNICSNFLQNGLKVLYFNLGMTDKELIQKLILICENCENKDNFQFFISDRSFVNTQIILEEMRNKSKYNCPDIIVIDYIQLIEAPNGDNNNRTNQISEITRELNYIAKSYNIPFIVLSQLNRDLFYRADKRPVLTDLLDSSSIENDADAVIFIYRDEIYYHDSPDKRTAEIIIAKYRMGLEGKIRLNFDVKSGKFSNYIDPPNYLASKSKGFDSSDYQQQQESLL